MLLSWIDNPALLLRDWKMGAQPVPDPTPEADDEGDGDACGEAG